MNLASVPITAPSSTAPTANSPVSTAEKMLTLSPSEFAIAIKRAALARVTLFGWGEPGTAKSSVAMQFATDEGMAYIDMRLSTKSPNDIRGFPFPVDDQGVKGVKWEPALMLPRNIDVNRTHDLAATTARIKFHNPVGKNFIHHCQKVEITAKAIDSNLTAVIVSEELSEFEVELRDASGKLAAGQIHYTVKGKARALVGLDEFNGATKMVQGASYSLVLDRFIDDYIVPDDVILLCMGNNESDGGVTYALAKTIENRMIHVNVKMTVEDFMKYAAVDATYPTVIGFIHEYGIAKLHAFSGKSPNRSQGTARTWGFVSRLMKANPDIIGPDGKIDKIGRAMICGSVGNILGLEFVTFHEFAVKMAPVQDILAGKVRSFEYGQNIALMVTNGAAVMQTLRTEYQTIVDREGKVAGQKPSAAFLNWFTRADNYFAFLTKFTKRDILLMMAKQAIKRYNLPLISRHMPVYDRFITENQEALANA